MSVVIITWKYLNIMEQSVPIHIILKEHNLYYNLYRFILSLCINWGLIDC